MRLKGRVSAACSHVVYVLLILAVAADRSRSQLPEGRSCFCKLHENVDECECSVDSVDLFNNELIHPLLQTLLERDFFRYYKVNMEKTCPYWQDDRSCGSEQCGIDNCDDQVPDALKQPLGHLPSHDKPTPLPCSTNTGDAGNEIDPLDTHISKDARHILADMEKHDVMDENQFCDVDDDDSASLHYVDLAANPERYTGYKGNSAQRVWQSIYMENCFKPNPKFDKDFLLHPSTNGGDLRGLCLEKRVFFRIISGLHTSITISIAAHNYSPPPGGFGVGTWSRNLEMFRARFNPEWTQGEGPQRLKNLYFVYLLELRALHKIAPFLSQELFYTGNEQEDMQTKHLVENLKSKLDSFPDHFDESAMFQYHGQALGRQLKEEFRVHFHNISRIMDCVDCDKCRLWGKVQVHGIGTALKVLFSDMPRSGGDRPRSSPPIPNEGLSDLAGQSLMDEHDYRRLKLSRNDLIALLQSFGRFSSSINEVAQFRLALEHI